MLFTDLACFSATTCFAVGIADDFVSSVIVPITDGVAGPRVVSEFQLSSIACMSVSTCEVLRVTLEGVAVVLPLVNGVSGDAVTIPGPARAGTSTCWPSLNPASVSSWPATRSSSQPSPAPARPPVWR